MEQEKTLRNQKAILKKEQSQRCHLYWLNQYFKTKNLTGQVWWHTFNPSTPETEEGGFIWEASQVYIEWLSKTEWMDEWMITETNEV